MMLMIMVLLRGTFLKAWKTCPYEYDGKVDLSPAVNVMAALPLESRFSQKAPSGFAGLREGGKGSRRGNPYLQFQSGARTFCSSKNISSCYALRNRDLKVVYKNGRGGLGEGWYALRRLEQDQGLGRGHRLAGELWLSVWVSNPTDFNISMSA